MQRKNRDITWGSLNWCLHGGIGKQVEQIKGNVVKEWAYEQGYGKNSKKDIQGAKVFYRLWQLLKYFV